MIVVWLTCVFQVPSYLTHVPSAFAVTSVTDVSSKMVQLCVFVTRLALLSTLLFVLLITRPTQTSVLWKSLHVRVVNASESWKVEDVVGRFSGFYLSNILVCEQAFFFEWWTDRDARGHASERGGGKKKGHPPSPFPPFLCTHLLLHVFRAWLYDIPQLEREMPITSISDPGRSQSTWYFGRCYLLALAVK